MTIPDVVELLESTPFPQKLYKNKLLVALNPTLPTRSNHRDDNSETSNTI